MSNKKSKWYKEIGGDWGCVKSHNKWIWYDCLICAKNFHAPEAFKTERWQGPLSKAIIEAKKRRFEGYRLECHGAAWHKVALERKLKDVLPTLYLQVNKEK